MREVCYKCDCEGGMSWTVLAQSNIESHDWPSLLMSLLSHFGCKILLMID